MVQIMIKSKRTSKGMFNDGIEREVIFDTPYFGSAEVELPMPFNEIDPNVHTRVYRKKVKPNTNKA